MNDRESFKRVLVSAADQPFIAAAQEVLQAKMAQAEEEKVAAQEMGQRPNLYNLAHPTNPLSTLPIKRAVDKNPGNLTGRQLKKWRKQNQREQMGLARKIAAEKLADLTPVE